MTANYGCFRSMKNSISPCHTAWSFQKCYLDALYFICSFGIPKAEDVAKIKKLSVSVIYAWNYSLVLLEFSAYFIYRNSRNHECSHDTSRKVRMSLFSWFIILWMKLDYEKLTPACSYNRRKTSPGCCHGKPMPWTVMEIMEAANNETKNEECMNNMGADVSKNLQRTDFFPIHSVLFSHLLVLALGPSRWFHGSMNAIFFRLWLVCGENDTRMRVWVRKLKTGLLLFYIHMIFTARIANLL